MGEVEQPTMSMTIGVNKSPFSGRSGAKNMTSSQIRTRLAKEIETNVAMRIEDSGDGDEVQVYGRGLLHLTVLIESMRREGFELMIGPPKVIFEERDGVKYEPFESVDVETPEEFASSVIAILNERKGMMVEMGTPTKEGMVSLQYDMPARGMVGVKS